MGGGTRSAAAGLTTSGFSDISWPGSSMTQILSRSPFKEKKKKR
jgi:hypothetical protein